MKKIFTVFVLLLMSWLTTTAQNGASSQRAEQTSAPYKVGDYYNENGKEGVVFEVDATGRHGKIVALTESPDRLSWCTKAEYVSRAKKGSTTTSATDGAYNMAQIKKIKGWQKKYPAFAYCAKLGEGWYLPAKDEWKALILDGTVYDAINKTLQSQNKPMFNRVKSYWASTQSKKYPDYSSSIDTEGTMYHTHKLDSKTVRAVSAF